MTQQPGFKIHQYWDFKFTLGIKSALRSQWRRDLFENWSSIEGLWDPQCVKGLNFKTFYWQEFCMNVCAGEKHAIPDAPQTANAPSGHSWMERVESRKIVYYALLRAKYLRDLRFIMLTSRASEGLEAALNGFHEFALTTVQIAQWSFCSVLRTCRGFQVAITENFPFLPHSLTSKYINLVETPWRISEKFRSCVAEK